MRDDHGVYMLARFDDVIPATPDVCDGRVLLVAETHDQTLGARWKQFHYSAFKGGSGHSGGVRFYSLFNNADDTCVPSWLHLSAVSIAGDDIEPRAKGLKNELLDRYVQTFGVLPRCNSRILANATSANGSADVADGVDSLVQGSEPSVVFTQWTRWVERANIEGKEHAGVYVLACFDGDRPASVNLTDERIIYIGETCDNDLAGRLHQFNRSAFEGKNGHSGGWSFSSRCEGQGSKLCISTFAVPSLNEPLRSAFIRHVERRLIWEFVKRWGRRPICNSK